MVDRVPARPPDRRFQEKSRQSERPARTWGQSRTEQKAKSKTPDSTNERVKSERSQNERLPKARQESLNESPLKEKVAQDASPRENRKRDGLVRSGAQGRSQSRPAKPPAPGASQHYPRQDRGTGPRPQEQQRGGPSKPGAVARDGISETPARPSRAGEQASRTAGGDKVRPFERQASPAPGQTRLRPDQAALKKPVQHLDDKVRPGEKIKTGAPKTQKSGAQRPAPKGRSEKRSAIAEHAEGRLRPRSAHGRKKGAGRSQEIPKPAQPSRKSPLSLVNL